MPTHHTYTANTLPLSLTRLIDRRNLQVSWTQNDEEDLGYYKIYRGLSEDFILNNESLIGTTNQNQFIDNELNESQNYYKVTAIDIHDNQSDSSSVVFSQSITGDMNFDFTVNVLDIVLLVDIVIDIYENNYTPTDTELFLSDIYQDGILNVIDIVGLVNIVLDQ